MPPITRNGARRGGRGRGGRGGNTNVQPQVPQVEAAPTPVEAAPAAVVQQNVQAMVVPPPVVPVIAPPNVDQVGVYSNYVRNFKFSIAYEI